MNEENKSSEVKTKNITSGLVIGWILGVIFAISGIVTIFSKPLSGIIFLIASALCLPPVSGILKKKYNFALSKSIKILVVLVLLVLGSVVGGKSTKNVVSSPTTVSTNTTQSTKTPQQVLEDNLSTISSKKFGVTNTSYQGLDVEKADPDRPKDSQMLTAKIDVFSFYNRDSLIKNTGEQASEAFQAMYSSNLNVADAFVWYYGKTKDRYGNEKNDVIISYSIDKATYSKINWQNFDKNNLCNFLKDEEKIQGLGSGPACNVLVNIE